MRTNLLISFIILLVFSIPILHAKIIHVPADSSTIQGAINGTVDGDTVMVAPCTYYEHEIDFHGKAILVTSQFPENSVWVASVVVDADSLGRVFHFHSREDSNSVLNGLTITGGAEDIAGGIFCDSSRPKITNCIITGNLAGRHGGGMEFRDSSAILYGCVIEKNIVLDGWGGGIKCLRSSPLIKGCMFLGNVVLDGAGGGLHLYESSPTIEYCTFEQDSAVMGGGIRIDYSAPTFTSCTIANNFATFGKGGGVECSNSSPLFIDCTFMENFAEGSGGGLYFLSSTPTLINCLISGNQGRYGGGVRFAWSPLVLKGCTVINNSAEYGGGLDVFRSSPSITNCTILGNTAFSKGGGIYCEESSPAPVITNSIFRYNSPEEIFVINSDNLDITYSNILGGWEGIGNIDILPVFRDPTSGDFHLMAVVCGDSIDSPCIDVGNPAILDSILDCGWGLGTELSDMGAFGGGKVLVGIDDQPKQSQTPKHFSLNQNYPNPFNPTTTISFDVPGEKEQVKLNVFDLRGRHVKSLIESALEPGNHRVVWDGKNERGERVSSGVYLYTLRVGRNTLTRKMAILQ